MSKKRIVKKQDNYFNGLFIYHDEHGRAIYSDFFTGNVGYYLTKDDVRPFSLYSMRLMGSLSVLVLLIYYFKVNTYVSIGISILVYLIASILFYFRFLKSLEVATSFTKTKKGFIKQSSEKYDYSTLYIMFAASILLSILSFINSGRISETLPKNGNVVISIIGLSYAVITFLTILNKIKSENRKK